MTDEIKEILDLLNIPMNESCACALEDYQCKLLLDYITNLQEKVEQYENPEDMTLFYMWLDEKTKDKMKKLQEENNNLKKDFKRHIDRINELTERSDNLQEENERLNNIIKSKDKIIKAAIRKLRAAAKHYNLEGKNNAINHTLNILKRDDKDD